MRHLILFVAVAAAGALPLSLQAAQPASRAEVARYAEQLLADSYADDGPGVALLVARGDQVLFRGSRGHGDVDADTPLSADDVFRIGSVTKQIASAGLLTLVDAGKVSLDDPLSKYVADYPNGANISVRQLLDHTSGVKSWTEIPGIAARVLEDVSTTQLIASFKDEKTDFAPGEGWVYNNSGYVLAGAVIEAASGQPWHRYLSDTLFEPLGMDDTGYGADPALVARLVNGHLLDGDKVLPANVFSMTWPHAGGALVSTVDDLHAWNRALHEGRVLKSATYQQMITPAGKAIDGKSGLGVVRGTVRGSDAISHNGLSGGFSSHLLYLPGLDISVAVLNNAIGPTQVQPMVLARKLAAVALGNPYPDARAIAIDAAALREVEGVYRIDANNTRVLRVVDGKLTGHRTGGLRMELMPVAKDSYRYADVLDGFDILRDGKGAVTAMRFYPEGEGEGVVVARSDEPLPAEAVAVTLPLAALERVAGSYGANNGLALKVFVEGGALKAQMGGPPAFDLTASSHTSFSVAAAGATLDFAAGEGAAQTVTVTQQGGEELAFKRVAE